MERKRIFAISGVKNSGKTTLICRLLEIFKDKGLKVAVLKHDGHDFVPDVPGTDTYCQLQSGAYGTAVFSAGFRYSTSRSLLYRTNCTIERRKSLQRNYYNIFIRHLRQIITYV